MNVAETIYKINSTVQSYLTKRGERTISADDAARLVYDAGIISPEGPPDAQGFAFRQFLRDLRDECGHDTLFLLLGVRQSRNQPHGRYVLYKCDAPSLENIKELLSISRNKSISVENQASERNSLPDYLDVGLDVIFVGTSVGNESAERDHYYSHSTNRFWDLVNRTGLVSDFVGAENDRFILEDKCGLTDLAKNIVSSSDGNLSPGDFDVAGFVQKVEKLKPKIVAFNGKRAYKEVLKHDPKDYGMAEDIISESYVFVLPSSSGTDTSLTFEQKLAWYQNLKGVVRTL